MAVDGSKFILLIIAILLGGVCIYLFAFAPTQVQQPSADELYGKGFCNKLGGFCDSILLNEDGCYSLIVSAIASQAKLGVETCENLDPFYRDKCYATIARESVLSFPSRAEGLCDKIDEESRQAWCVQDVAVFSYSPESSKSVEICRGISDPSLSDECFFLVAKRASEFGLNDAKEICDEISFESVQKTCTAVVTSKYDSGKAVVLCNDLQDAQEREGCLAKLSE